MSIKSLEGAGRGGALSSAEASILCVVGRLGRKKKRARGARYEGEKEKRGSRLSPLPIFPCALSNFSNYCYFYMDTQREPMRRTEGRGEGGGGGCTAINPDAVPSVHVTKVATCTGKHSIFRISRKIEECEQSTYKVNSRFSEFITFIPCALICQKLVNFLELNSKKNCIEV